MESAIIPSIDIIIPVPGADVPMALACLKTLEVNPPSIDFQIHLLVQEKDVTSIEDFLVESQCLKIASYVGNLAQAVNIILLGSNKPYSMFVHPDCLFVNEQWCDMLLSMMIQQSLGAISTQPFENIELSNNLGIAQCFRGDVIIVQNHLVKECGGVPSDVPDYAIALGLQARMVKNHVPFGGSEISQFITHMGKCSLDKSKLSYETRINAARVFEREYVNN